MQKESTARDGLIIGVLEDNDGDDDTATGICDGCYLSEINPS